MINLNRNNNFKKSHLISIRRAKRSTFDLNPVLTFTIGEQIIYLSNDPYINWTSSQCGTSVPTIDPGDPTPTREGISPMNVSLKTNRWTHTHTHTQKTRSIVIKVELVPLGVL